MSHIELATTCYHQDRLVISTSKDHSILVLSVSIDSQGVYAMTSMHRLAHHEPVCCLYGDLQMDLLFVGSYSNHLYMFSLSTQDPPLFTVPLPQGMWCHDSKRDESHVVVQGTRLVHSLATLCIQEKDYLIAGK